MNKNKKYRFVFLILFLGNMGLNTNVLYSQHFTEYEVKAVFLVNFAKFVQWESANVNIPKNSKKIIIGIYGNNPFGEIYNNKSFQDIKINGEKLKIISFKRVEDIDCNILFVSDVDKYEMIQVINYTKSKPILTVGDNIDEFCEKGGMINFTEKGNRHRFEINNNAALKVNIKISSKLLHLAKIIKVNEIKF